jgi:hypothetical protein
MSIHARFVMRSRIFRERRFCRQGVPPTHVLRAGFFPGFSCGLFPRESFLAMIAITHGQLGRIRFSASAEAHCDSPILVFGSARPAVPSWPCETGIPVSRKQAQAARLCFGQTFVIVYPP